MEHVTCSVHNFLAMSGLEKITHQNEHEVDGVVTCQWTTHSRLEEDGGGSSGGEPRWDTNALLSKAAKEEEDLARIREQQLRADAWLKMANTGQNRSQEEWVVLRQVAAKRASEEEAAGKEVTKTRNSLSAARGATSFNVESNTVTIPPGSTASFIVSAVAEEYFVDKISNTYGLYKAVENEMKQEFSARSSNGEIMVHPGDVQISNNLRDSIIAETASRRGMAAPTQSLTQKAAAEHAAAVAAEEEAIERARLAGIAEQQAEVDRQEAAQAVAEAEAKKAELDRQVAAAEAQLEETQRAIGNIVPAEANPDKAVIANASTTVDATTEASGEVAETLDFKKGKDKEQRSPEEGLPISITEVPGAVSSVSESIISHGGGLDDDIDDDSGHTDHIAGLEIEDDEHPEPFTTGSAVIPEHNLGATSLSDNTQTIHHSAQVIPVTQADETSSASSYASAAIGDTGHATSVTVSSGGSVTKMIQDVAAKSGKTLSADEAWNIYSHMREHLHGMDGTYTMDNGHTGLSSPGEIEVSANVVGRINELAGITSIETASTGEESAPETLGSRTKNNQAVASNSIERAITSASDALLNAKNSVDDASRSVDKLSDSAGSDTNEYDYNDTSTGFGRGSTFVAGSGGLGNMSLTGGAHSGAGGSLGSNSSTPSAGRFG